MWVARNLHLCHQSVNRKRKTLTPAKKCHDITLMKIQYIMVPPRDAVFALVGILCILTCMQARMATLYNLHCIYRLHNLNIQLALLEYERVIRQRRWQRRYNPYRWCLLRPRGSWFEIHFNSCAVPPHYFKTQLRMDRDTFDVLLNLLHPSLLRQNTSLRDCIRCWKKYGDRGSSRCY